MNASRGTQTVDPTGEPLDRLLRDYFRKEMPAAFPAPALDFAVPADVSAPKRRERSLFRSRIVLAISLAVVAIGSWIAVAKRSDSTVQRPMTNFNGSEAKQTNPFRSK